jgi:hypothetical protein
MELTIQQARKLEFYNNLYPDTGVDPGNNHDPNKQPDYHHLGLFIILCFDEDTRKKTFPVNAKPNSATLFERYQHVFKKDPVTKQYVITDDHVFILGRYREAFEGVFKVWANYVEYSPQPCPSRAAIAELVRATQDLPGSGGPNPEPE